MVAKRRRRHSSQFKKRVLEEASEPDVSVAEVARRYGLNANLIHKWRTAARTRGDAVPAPGFLALPPPARQPADLGRGEVIRIEIPHPDGAITITWPASQADRAVSLLRELLL